MKKVLNLICSILLIVFVITGCNNSHLNSEKNQLSNKKNEITVAVRTKDDADIVEAANEELVKMGYFLNVKMFDDNVMPNMALEEGTVDANLFQHIPYLEKFNEEKGTDITNFKQRIYFAPQGVYSNKYDDLSKVEPNSKVGIPNDVANIDRCLKILESIDLLELEEVDGLTTQLNIINNRLNLEILEMDHASLPASSQDLDLILVNKRYVESYNEGIKYLLKEETAEEVGDIYGILLSVKRGDENTQWGKDLLKAMTNDKVKKCIESMDVYIPLF